jgi:sigma-B regulation protein RsbU (phosphoserine phosphatase)
LIDQVMDLARGRLGGGFPLQYDSAEAFEPALRQVIAELRAAAPSRTIEDRLDLAEPVECDSRRIAQLASNLLSNAIVHGAADQPVRIQAATKGGWLELFVVNRGEPIPQAILDRIFEPFKRGLHDPNRAGLGLGLYISREIAVAHGGGLVVTSTPTETRFTLRMPTSKVALADHRSE